MMKAFKQVKEDALRLDLRFRAELAQALLLSLDDPSSEEHERLWFEEAERRQRDVAEGRVSLVPGSEVLRRLADIG